MHPRALPLVAAAALATSCKTIKVCPDKAHTLEPELGDVNGDGKIDIADGVFLQRYAYREGQAPVCDAAWDMNGSSPAGTAESAAIWSYLFTGGVADLGTSPSDCKGAELPTEPGCAQAGFDIDAPRKVETNTFSTKLKMRFDPPSLGRGAEGWSLGLVAEGCTITSATTAGTAAADKWDGGLRDLGFEYTELTDKGVISAVVLSWWEPVEFSGERAVLSLEVDGNRPASGCNRCKIRMENGLAGSGQIVQNVITADGFTYRPELESWTVKVCAP